ncbi:MAG: SGNH/GDSL hydrolase family protein [Candidatus Methylacidiphilales bacterium]
MAAALAAATLLPATPAAFAQETLKDGDLVAICGDSITARRVYSVYMEAYLLAAAPKARLQATQFGWGGERAPAFLQRMQNDVLRYKPTVATTCYGMNDGSYAASDPETIATYKAAMLDIVKKFKEGGVRFIVVGSPGVVDTGTYGNGKRKTTAEVYNKTLGDLANAAKQVAADQGVSFADVHSLMSDVMAKARARLGEDYVVAGMDGVHPSNNGHLIMAHAFLKALGCDGNVGTITVDLKSGTAKGSDGQKILSSTGAKTELESSRYPFCFPPSTAKPQDKEKNKDKEVYTAESILEFLPFQQELNRYTLIVKNAPADAKSLKVTWGKTSKTFPASDLEKGINLAEAFREDNPIIPTFAKILEAVQAQQGLEEPAMMSVITKLPAWEKFLGPGATAEDKAALNKMVERMESKLKTLRDASSAAAIPVRHTILVEKAE